MNTISFLSLLKRELVRFLTNLNQMIFPVVVSSLLYLVIFHLVLSKTQMGGGQYISFLLPGIVMMAIINTAFANASFSLFITRWTKHAESLFIIPLKPWQFVAAYLLSGLARTLLTAAIILVAAMFFLPISISSIFLLLGNLIAACILFGSLGIILALWAETFEQLGLFTTFFLTPLTMLGGVFYSLNQLPEFAKTLTLLNPVFYLVDGFRAGMGGIPGFNPITGLLISGVMGLSVLALVIYLFSNGWKIKQ